MKKSESPKNIDDCIVRIMRLALQVNRETKHDVFVNFSGHVKLFTVEVFYGGWSMPYKPDFKAEFYLGNLSPDRFTRCAKIRTQLENLLNEKQGKIDKNA